MKHLHQFEIFDFKKFSEGKVYLTTGCSPWKDYNNTSVVYGTKVEAAIVKDETPYVQKEGEHTTNRFEKIVFKVAKSNMSIPPNSYIQPVNPVATIWGTQRNNLSVRCDDIEILQLKNKQ